MNDTATPEPSSPAQITSPPTPGAPPPGASAAAPPPSGIWVRFAGVLALILAIVTLLLIAWQWHDSRAQTEALRQELARKLAEADTVNKQAKLLADQAKEASADAQVKLGVLESRLADSQSQQIALEALYQELSRGRDEWVFAEIEQTLLIASQQLQLAGNVKSALIALQNADARLQRMERPQLTPLRKAINRDIDRLKALPFVDSVGISVKLDNVVAAVDALPLAVEVRPPAAASTEAPREEPVRSWQRFLGEAWTELKQLVRIQNMERPEMPLLAPAQQYFLRENLKSRLLGARLALLSRDQTSFKADLTAAREWMTRYYDTRDKAVANALATLRNLQESDITVATPDIAGTLDALRALRVAHERAPR
jgi:uroporphyrin-III C-methyltransferase